MTIDEFQKAELRVGTVLSAERVEGSEKLLKLSVDLGEPRQILSGIAKAYDPAMLVGKQVVIIANLDPRTFKLPSGEMQSNGMLLAAHGDDGTPVLLAPLAEVPPGAKIS